MSIGLKEWALICDAIGSGQQSIIIRKGGIHEGRDGFRFKHSEFFLFPTAFHEQLDRLKLPSSTPLPAKKEGEVSIKYFARVEWTELVTDLDCVRELAPFHLWKDQVIEERFRYDEPAGVHVAFLRAYRLSNPWEFPDAPAYGGCRSWVELPNPPAGLALQLVIDDHEQIRRGQAIRKILQKKSQT